MTLLSYINYFKSILVVALAMATTTAWAASSNLDVAAIERAADVKATIEDDGVVRIGWTRDKTPVKVDGMQFPPAAGLGSWAAFKSLPNGDAVVMGDTVVFEDEITPAMDAAFDHGLKVTALHKHFTTDRPPVYFMHIGGQADSAEKLAKGVRAMWDAIKQMRAEHPTPGARFPGKPVSPEGELDKAELQQILGVEAQDKGKVVKFVFPRQASIHDTEITHTMGVATWAAFVGNKDYASVDGDFAMTADEAQSVMHTLRDAGIHIVALHNHMIGEKPVYYFLHYWGKGDPTNLARGIRRAVEQQHD